MRHPVLAVALAGGLLAAGPLAASAADAPPGKIVVAKTNGAAVVLYDATPEVADIVKSGMTLPDANARLERDALRVLAKEQAVLAGATSVTVRVTYAKSGDVSPVYGTATFQGIERYANLTISAADVRSDAGKWREAATGSGTLPSSATFTVVGALPPRS